MLRSNWREALDRFDKAARVAKRPIDLYNAHLGAGLAAIYGNVPDRAARELEAAARVDGIAADQRDFTKVWLGRLGRAPAPEPAAAPGRPETKKSSGAGGKSN